MKSPKSSAKQIDRPWAWWAPAIVLLVGIIAYADSFHGPFIFDDIEIIGALQKSPDHGFVIETAGPGKPLTSMAGRPLLQWSLAIDYAIGGDSVEVYHATNLAIHLAAALTLLGLVILNLRRREFWGDRFSKSATAIATISAALWVAHPLNTAAVTYIVQRAESMSALFYLLTLYCFVRTVQSSKHQQGWWIAAVTACAAGMASKQIMATAPLVILLYDRTFLAGSFLTALRLRWKMHLSFAATWIILAACMYFGERGIDTVGLGLGISSLDYATTQLGVIAHYLRLMVWPRGLVLDYDWPIVPHGWQGLIAGWLTLALLIATAVLLWIKPWAGFVGAWFFIILGPTSSFAPIVTEIAAEHRMYLPMIAPIVLAVAGGWELLRHLTPMWNARVRTVAATAVIGVIVTVLVVLTILRNADYSTAERIWRDTVAKQPDSPRAHYNLAFSLDAAGDLNQAVKEYNKTLQLYPRPNDEYLAAAHLAQLHFILGSRFAQQAKWQEAKKELDASLQTEPNNSETHHRLAIVLVELGEFKEAQAQEQQAKALSKNNSRPRLHSLD